MKVPLSPRYHHVMTWPIFTMWSWKRPDLPITFCSQTGEFCDADASELHRVEVGAEPLWWGPHRLNSMCVGWAYCAPQ